MVDRVRCFCLWSPCMRLRRFGFHLLFCFFFLIRSFFLLWLRGARAIICVHKLCVSFTLCQNECVWPRRTGAMCTHISNSNFANSSMPDGFYALAAFCLFVFFFGFETKTRIIRQWIKWNEMRNEERRTRSLSTFQILNAQKNLRA